MASNSRPLTSTEASEMINAILARLPEHRSLKGAEVQSMSKVTSVAPEAVKMAIEMLAIFPALSAALGRDAAQVRQEGVAVWEWASVLTEAEALHHAIESLVRIQRHRLGLLTLQVYNVSRQLLRGRNDDQLAAWVESMQERMKLKGRKKKREEPSEEPGVS